jgi:Ran GTPase-activating protein (RanGAP) involved in mRNA processing and transport
MACIEISGDTPTAVAKSIQDAIEDHHHQADDDDDDNVQQIRLFNIDVSRLSADGVAMLERLVNSRPWERVVIIYCSGHLSENAMRGILQTKCLELYGETLNLLEAYAKKSSSSTIEIMKLRNRFDHSSILPLTEIISTNETLKMLHLTCEFPDRESVASLAMGLEKNKQLTLLSLYSCELLDDSSMQTLIRSLVNHPTLATLALQDNNHFGMSAIVELVSQTRVLEHLQLYHPALEINEIQIPQLNVETLSIALKQNKSLKVLDLSNNGLHDGSAMCLAVALRFNTTLESLNLQGNVISDKGAMCIGKALPKMKGLKELFLWNNRFKGVGARALLAGLKKNVVLEIITTFSRFRVAKELHYYTHLNRAGRCMLKDPNSLPMNVWPLVLDRVNSQDWEDFQKASVLYTLLREGPAAVAT